MSDFDLIIVGGLVVTADEVGEFDIGIKNEKISELAPRGGLSSKTTSKTIDAKGGYVMVCQFWIKTRTPFLQIITARRHRRPRTSR